MQLMTDEEKMFAVSVATPWIKGKMDVDHHNIMIDIPNTVLFGLIPAGRRKHTTPLGNISNVYTSSSYKLGRIFGGAIIALFGLLILKLSLFMSFLFILLGVLLVSSGILTVFQYENNGHSITIPLPFFEAHRAESFSETVIHQINQYNDDRNGRLNTQFNIDAQNKHSQAIIDAIKNQNN
ncbi:DUF2892 domain-containing protein [Staphylococcus sp. 17KM0847]|uniref:DUF2892 domain-containing protein n=1 Tax=Staphylococcus sp. 17KM0847 TaxID=2583989 RepID=UPI0015DBDD95|nr:DUF2892 domain-containing protein [Staphylococcus sp. 17KM0847]QLK85257.1 DUF2892 domain-containing protein [Staphylococcus sp. 17KM0847]